jgi:glycine cleavage system H lipoate-binding protein
MSAGIVNYKLCNQEFDCEVCEFDKVMRGILAPQGQPGEQFSLAPGQSTQQNAAGEIQEMINRYLYALFSGCQLHMDRCYHPSHLWYKSSGNSTIQVGADTLLLKILEPVDRIVLPQTGETYSAGQLIAWIVRKEQILPLHSALKGTVTEINPVFLTGGFKRVMSDDSWLFKMEGEGLPQTVLQMCSNLRGLQSYSQKVGIIKSHLKNAFRDKQKLQIGPTLADGGSILIGLEKVLGEGEFSKLIEELF